jgi:RNA polymerase sigma factor (sigma-70 family)
VNDNSVNRESVVVEVSISSLMDLPQAQSSLSSVALTARVPGDTEPASDVVEADNPLQMLARADDRPEFAPAPKLPLSSTAMRSFFRTAEELEVWKLYRTERDRIPDEPTKIACEARAELLKRHGKILNKLAWNMFSKYGAMADIGDFQGYAYMGAMISYDRFNEDKAEQLDTRLSTFVHRTVQRHIQSEIDNGSPIHCPTQRRGMRSYIMGRYDDDPEKKAQFEEENGLTTEDARAAAKAKFGLLKDSIISLETPVSNTNDRITVVGDLVADWYQPSQEDLVSRIDREAAVAGLNSRQREIYSHYFVNDLSMQECAEEMGLTEGQVRGEIRTIRKIFRTAEAESNI